ncbi:MAG: ankyrin repeat domain-containing protein [Alphaproteobacteria bacterium]|nr:ankyrin repeat domain-containing protein [Alphaproteobacteria bacterium]
MSKNYFNLILRKLIFLFIIFLTFNSVSLAQSKSKSPFKEGLVVSAVKSGTMEDLIYSIQVGSSPSELDFDEVPALLLAVDRGRHDMTLFLLNKGARVDQRDGKKRTALSIAARKNNISIINELINFGAKLDRYGANKETPLIIASRFGNYEAVSALLEGGAYPDDTDLTGRTALQWAKIKHFKRIENLLEEYGAYSN